MKKELKKFADAISNSPCMTNHLWTEIEDGAEYSHGVKGIECVPLDNDSHKIYIYFDIFIRWSSGGGWSSGTFVTITDYNHFIDYLNNHKTEVDNYFKLAYGDIQHRIFYILEYLESYILETAQEEKHNADV